MADLAFPTEEGLPNKVGELLEGTDPKAPEWVGKNGYPFCQELESGEWLVIHPLTYGRWRLQPATEIGFGRPFW